MCTVVCSAPRGSSAGKLLGSDGMPFHRLAFASTGRYQPGCAMRHGEGEVGIDGRGWTARLHACRSKSSSAGAAEESGAANRAWRAANQDRGTVNRAWGLPACELGDRVYQARSGSRRNQELQDVDPGGTKNCRMTRAAMWTRAGAALPSRPAAAAWRSEGVAAGLARGGGAEVLGRH